MIVDLAHAAFDVHDMDASLAFYGHLGLKESFRLFKEDGSLMLVYIHLGGDRFLELFPNGPEPGSGGRGSFAHFCLMTDALHAEADRLRGLGITITSGPSLGLDNNWQAWVADPDGNRIELMQISPDSPQARIARGEAVAATDRIGVPGQ